MTRLQTERGTIQVPAGTWKADPAHSSVAFEVKHMMIATVRGLFSEFDGTLEAEEDPTASRAHGWVNVASIDTGNADRDAHLRSPDFFDADRHPRATFASTRIEHARSAARSTASTSASRGSSCSRPAGCWWARRSSSCSTSPP
jgi:polyisoprenoid-binding protein YceI